MKSKCSPDFEKRGGLIVVVVQDANTKEVLMQAYANEQAWHKTLETHEVWLWSTERNELWHKGETSDGIMKVKEICLDCDGDCALMMVEVLGRGLACHEGRKSCFTQLFEVGEPTLAKLFGREPQILVIGNAFDGIEPTPELTAMAREIGRLIAQAGATLMFGGETRVSSYPTITGKAARMAGGISVAFPPNNSRHILEMDAATIVCPLSVDVGGPRETFLSRMGDAVIVIGGGSGTAVEALSAYQDSIPLICIKGSGGWADKLLRESIDHRNPWRVIEGADTAEEAVEAAITEIWVEYGTDCR